MEKLHIIGYGPGDENLLTEKAKNAMTVAKRILSTSRISGTDERIHGLGLTELMAELKNSTGEETAVLVSGDSGFFSVAKTIVKDFSSIYEIEVIPGIGSIQYFSAKIKTPYDDAVLVSLHGRSGNIVPKVAYNKKVFALTGGVNSAKEICHTLNKHGLGDVRVSIGERLSYPDERILHATAVELQETDFDELTVLYIENPSAVNPHTPLSDSTFLRGEIPMTKEEIRWLSIQKLGVSPSDIVYDIGAGTGSVSVEMARKAFDGFVYAVEKNEDACTLVRQNIAKHGTFNIEIIHGEAPSSLEGLPVPDKAFIGGSSGNMDGILQKLISLNPGIKIVVNAITIQTLNQAIEGFTRYGITDTDIICVNIAKAKKTGPYDMMTAQNPVFIITGRGDSSRV
jgi:precorrin-6Y C5,15-methyltransferase (decarboxylating)